jgi:hypothetical protein
VRSFVLSLAVAFAVSGCTASLKVSCCNVFGPAGSSLGQPRCENVMQRDGSIIRTCEQGSDVTLEKIGGVSSLPSSNAQRKIAKRQSPASPVEVVAAQKTAANEH